MFDFKLTAHLAELSKIAFTEKELETITGEMDSIVSLMDTVSDFKPEIGQDKNASAKAGKFRQDNIKPSLERQKILANAKEKKDNFFVVPEGLV